jgi:hypothetical protein
MTSAKRRWLQAVYAKLIGDCKNLLALIWLTLS